MEEFCYLPIFLEGNVNIKKKINPEICIPEICILNDG